MDISLSPPFLLDPAFFFSAQRWCDYGNIKRRTLGAVEECHLIYCLPPVSREATGASGMTVINMTANNQGLPPLLFTFSQQGHRAYFETRIALSGAVLPESILWTHANTLFDVPRNTNPGLGALIHKDMANFIKESGRPSERGAVLDQSTVTALEESENPKTAHRAMALQSFILENRNRLIEDEARLASLLGVGIGVVPTYVQWDRWTHRIDVAWTARTTNVLEAVKLGILAPPDDEAKRDLVRRMLSEKRWYVERALKQFWDNGTEFEEWWTDE